MHDTSEAGAAGSPRSASTGAWPYILPYLAFGAILALRDAGEGRFGAVLSVAQVAVPAGLLLFHAARGAFPELLDRLGAAREWLADIGLGIGIAVLWVAPFLLFPGLPRPPADAGFEAAFLGSETATLALRFAGFALVTPFMEELFVRSFLLRFLDVFDTDADFRTIPIGRFAWRSFIGTVVWFTVTHQTWEWIVALPTGILLNLWLYRRRRMGSVVLAHAAANASIFAFVILWAPDHPALWIFL